MSLQFLRLSKRAIFGLTIALLMLAAQPAKAQWPDVVEAKSDRRGGLHLRPADRDELRASCTSTPWTRTPGNSRRRSTRSRTRRRVFTYKDTADRHAEQRHALLVRLAGPARRADRALRAGGGRRALLLGAADRRQHLQLRLHRQPRHRQRGRRLHGGRAGLEGRDAAGHQEGVPLRRRSSRSRAFRTQLFDPADMPNVEKVQAGYKVQPLSAFLQAARAARRAGDRLPARSTTELVKSQLLRVSRLRSAVRAGRQPDEKEIRAKLAQHRRRPRQDLRLQGPAAGAQGGDRGWA